MIFYLFLILIFNLSFAICEPNLEALQKSNEQKIDENGNELEQITNSNDSKKIEIKKKGEKKSKSSWFSSSTAIKHMTLDELAPAKERYLKDGKKNFACSCLERMITLENDHYKQEALRLESARLCVDLEEFDKAETEFKEFITMYPNSKSIEDVYLQAANCALKETLTSDRDQTKTKDCLEFTRNYLENVNYTKYKKDMHDIRKQCYQKLIENEIYVCKFYIKKGKCKGAQQRIDFVKKEYLPELPNCEKDILIIECQLAQKNNDHELYKQKSAELKNKFPELQAMKPEDRIIKQVNEQNDKLKNKHKPYSKRF